MRSTFTKLLMIFCMAVLVFMSGPRVAAAATLELGNSSENILNGGVLASDSTGNITYYANTKKNGRLYALQGSSEKKLTSDTAANINVIGKKIYYTTGKGSGSVVYCYNVSTGKKSSCFTSSTVIDEMYVDSAGTFYYLSGGKVYTRGSGDKESTLTEGNGKIVHFIPTAYGMITATGSSKNYKLYADGKSIRSGVTRFYTVDGYLILTVSGNMYQAKISSLFGSSPSSAVKKYTLGSSSEALSALTSALSSDDCEVCEENAKEYGLTGVLVDDVNPVTATGTTSILNDSSVSDGQRNIVLRARQQYEITWTPLKTITGWGGAYTFSAGTTYQGLPYGQPVTTGSHVGSYVPWGTSLDEFAAAVADSSSKMYTSKATYNKTAPYYSCDCSSFVSWSWNLSSRQTTSTLGKFGTAVASQSIYSVEIGDAFVLAGSHTVLVTDVGYGSSGSIVYIDITEQTPPKVKRTRYGEGGSYTLAYMANKYLVKNVYTLYRSNTRDSVTYTASSAVTLDGETKSSSSSSTTGTISLANTTLTLDCGSTGTISYTATATGTASWKSSNSAVAKVSGGTVTGVAGGSATITLTIGSVSAKATVYVKPATVTLSSASPTAATTTNTGGIKVKWKAVTGATSYEVFRKNSSGSWESLGTTTSVSYTNKGLSYNTSYTYTVRAIMTMNGTSYYGPYDTTGITGTTRRAAPVLTSITAASNTSQTVNWEAVEGAAGYKVYQKVNGSWKLLAKTTKTSYTVKSLTTGTSYTYTVRSYFTVNGKTVLGCYNSKGISKTCCPPAPTLSSASCDSDGNITITWKKVTGVTGYRIYRKTAGGKWKSIKTIRNNKTFTYTDSGLTNGTTYIYTVRAYKKVSKKNVWGSYDTTGLSCASIVQVPDAVQLVSAVCSGYESITLTWNKVSGVTGYRIYRKTAGGKWKSVKTIRNNKTFTYTNTGLTYGTEYIYTVRAYRKVSKKNYWGTYDTDGISCTVEAPAPSTISASVKENKVTVSWEAVSGISGYRIYYKTESGSWKLADTVGKKKASATIEMSSAGEYYFSIRSYWKVSGKRYFSSYTATEIPLAVNINTGE